MSHSLEGKKIAFLATTGFEQIELTQPWSELKDAGADVVLVSLEKGSIKGFNHMEPGDDFNVDQTLDEVTADDFDGVVLPGGVHNPDALRTDNRAVQFVRDFFRQHKSVAAICHGPWLLVEADVLAGRILTSWQSLKTDIENSGGSWVDQEVVVDEGLVTSRNPDDLDAFCTKTIEVFSEGRHRKQVA